MCIFNLGQITNNKDKFTNVYVDDSVDKEFANNVISQYEALNSVFGDGTVKNIIILDSPTDIKKMSNDNKRVSRFLNGKGRIAFGLHTRKDDTICIIQSNHLRKNEAYEGDLETQGADTLTHEFGHSLDKKLSTSEEFKAAYLLDLLEFERNLSENPDEKIAGSDMSYKEARQYFRHYLRGVNFSDGIDRRDLTRRGLRENFAESFSIVFDSSKSEVNDIYTSIFSNSVETVENMFVA